MKKINMCIYINAYSSLQNIAVEHYSCCRTLRFNFWCLESTSI